ncbi:MAG TPA: magnesium transporter CorA family protein [Anaerolineales bacterium]|nr:magnesium transporter CorA family protein [Anaerolineales bacterium]
MINFYKTSEGELTKLDSPVSGSWINVVDPTPEEIAYLTEKIEIYPDLINYSLDLDEMPRIERDDDEGYTFILLRIPRYQGDNVDVPYTTIPLGIIIVDGVVVSVCRYETDILKPLLNGKYRGLKTGKRYRFVLYLFLEAAIRYLGHLRDINKATEALEDQLEKSTRNREVLQLVKYQKSLTYFATALRSNEVMMERVQRMKLFNQYDEDADLLEDVLTENQQAIQMTSIATEILSGMMDAFASIISNNLNGVMKGLAALTIILNLPTIVASFYGMNVKLPGEGHPLAFLTVIGLAVGLTAVATFIFYKRDWF